MDTTEKPQFPEIVIGLVAPYGTPLTYFTTTLTSKLKSTCDYNTDVLRLSAYTKMFKGLDQPYPSEEASEFQRVDALMTRGNQARQLTESADVLALCAINDIQKRRSQPNTVLPKSTFVLRQLKHPAEVYKLREVYNDGFHLVGLHSPLEERERHLRLQYGMSQQEINTLIGRDEEEPDELGQHVRDTFHLSDVFFRINADGSGIDDAIERWLELLFGLEIHTPKQEEFGMFQAYGAALRSGQLSRQVGAAILTDRGDLIAVGTNEVSRAGGGQYWEGDRYDERDHHRGEDSNDVIKREILMEAVAASDASWHDLSVENRRIRLSQVEARLKGSRLSNLTEFVRAVHAEMEAVLSAARTGASTRGATLYCTTFPCHNCAKHIVGAGIRRVVYIEPYSKSLSPRLHDDSISFDKREPHKITFTPFVGIAPRRYSDLFSMTTKIGIVLQRKDADGKLLKKDQPELRLRMPHFSSLEEERKAAGKLLESIPRENP